MAVVGQLDPSLFPFLQKVTYLDSAAVGPVSRPALAAMEEYYMDYPLNYGVGQSPLAEGLVGKIDAARDLLATVVGAAPDELVFAKNTTECINTVAGGLEWTAGDEIIISDVEHQSNAIPWYAAAQRAGANVHVARSNADHLIEPDEIARLMTPRTKLVALTYMSNIFGSVQWVDEIGKMVRSKGVLYFVDAAQAGGRWPVSVENCDFMAFCGRKSWNGPQATAFLYVRQECQDLLRPIIIGSRAADLHADGTVHVRPAPYRFEAGILNTAGVIGLAASAALLQQAGLANIRSRIRTLSSRLADGLSNLPVKVVSCRVPDRQGGVISWVPLRYRGNTEELSRALFDEAKIICAAGPLGSRPALARVGAEGVVRTSVHAFNTEADVDSLLHAVGRLLA